MTQAKKLITIITPCYNEERMLRLYSDAMALQMEKIDNDRYDYELVFVNDGSTDSTQKLLMALARKDPHIKYISLSRNFGKEAAMLAALEMTAGDCAIIMDADLQHPPCLIPKMLERFEEGYDQVIGKRNRKGDPKKMTFFARSYYKIFNKLIDVKVVDGAGDFRLLSRQAIDAIICLKETNRFSKGLFSWIGFESIYLDYENQPRIQDDSRWTLRNLARYGLDGILSFNNKPLRFCVYAGGILLAISMLYLIYLFVKILIYGVDLPGYFTTITLISVLGGVQLISLGIIGEYVGRIYAEVKKRPIYIVSKTNIR